MKRDFGVLLRETRKQAELSLRNLADEVGLSVTYLCRIEKGQSKVSPKALELLLNCRALGLPYVEAHWHANMIPRGSLLVATETPESLKALIEWSVKLESTDADCKKA